MKQQNKQKSNFRMFRCFHLPTYLHACRPACLSVYLSVYLYVYLAVCLSVCMTVCLSVYLSGNEHLRGKSGPIPQLFAHRLHVYHILFYLLPKAPVPQSLRPRPQGRGGGGILTVSSYVSSGPASTPHSQKISGIPSTPKKYLKF